MKKNHNITPHSDLFVAQCVNILSLLKTSNISLLFATCKCPTVSGMLPEQEKDFEGVEDVKGDCEEIR